MDAETGEEGAGEQPTETKAIVEVLKRVREGEYGAAARYEFPDNNVVFEVMAAAGGAEKRYKLYFFDNVLVASEYSPEIDAFLEAAAAQAGYMLQIEDVTPQEEEAPPEEQPEEASEAQEEAPSDAQYPEDAR